MVELARTVMPELARPQHLLDHSMPLEREPRPSGRIDIERHQAS